MSFEKVYDRRAKKISKLREALKANPDNDALKAIIESEEESLFRYIRKSGKELQKLMIYQQEQF